MFAPLAPPNQSVAKHQPKLKLWGELLTIWAWAQHCAWVVGGLPLGLNLNVDCSRGVQFATMGMGAVAYAWVANGLPL